MIKFLSEVKTEKIKGKICLLRVDLNVEKEERKKSIRILTIIPAIKFLTRQKATVLLLSHFGRPPVLTEGENSLKSGNVSGFASYSLRPFASIIGKEIGQVVKFLPKFDFLAIKKKIDGELAGGVFLLENLRFLEGEAKNDSAFARDLASLGDFFVNEAFAVSHRENASTLSIPKFLLSYAGFQLEKEIKQLNSVMKNPARPLTLILGGAKVKDKEGVIDYFEGRADYILLGGGPANTFLKAHGVPIGDSVYDDEADLSRLLGLKNVIIPSDWITEKGKIFDIGPETIKQYTEIIKMSRTVIWSGPLGLVEKRRFALGSETVARGIARVKNRIFSVLGGGETTGFVSRLGLAGRFDLVSTGGGAMLEYLSGKKLPGIEALDPFPHNPSAEISKF